MFTMIHVQFDCFSTTKENQYTNMLNVECIVQYFWHNSDSTNMYSTVFLVYSDRIIIYTQAMIINNKQETHLDVHVHLHIIIASRSKRITRLSIQSSITPLKERSFAQTEYLHVHLLYIQEKKEDGVQSGHANQWGADVAC